MKLYKYRSLKDMEFALDILLNERLHCAPYNELNDPFEGMFFSSFYTNDSKNYLLKIYYKPGTKIKEARSVRDIPSVSKSKVCSLSATMSDVRLWSYYADGHQGIAIEIDFTGKEADIKKISYVKELQERGSTFITSLILPEEAILTFKTNHWHYEQEYRIIQENDYYQIPKAITAIYTGMNVSDTRLALLRKIVPSHIPIVQTKINPYTLEIEPKVPG